MMEEATTEQGRRIDLDKAGATASLTCAVHCALMPLVVTLLPLLCLSFLADERTEWGLLGLSALLGLSSLCLGYREHRRRQALAVLAVGLAVLVLGRVTEERRTGAGGVLLVVAGGCITAASHFLNRRMCRSCRTCRTNGDGQRPVADAWEKGGAQW